MIHRRRSGARQPLAAADLHHGDADADAGAGAGGAQISSSPAGLFSSDRKIWALCLVFRAANALLVQTYFNPDEHWQSLEVAHRIAFGYGHLTWEWKEGIRSYLHPLIFALLYKLMAFLRLDTPWFMIKAPRLLQSLFSSFGDVYLYKLSKLVFDEHVARWVLFSQLANWFVFFCTTRPLSNSLETMLTVVGLFYWLSFRVSSKPFSCSSRKLALVIAGLACAIRPTSAITWLYLGLLDLLTMQDRLRFLFLEVLPIGVLVLVFTCYLDWWMYGSWTIVPLNFLKFNFLSSGGDYYGTHKWHWYFSQGFPVMAFTFLPFAIFGMLKSKEWKLSCLIAWDFRDLQHTWTQRIQFIREEVKMSSSGGRRRPYSDRRPPPPPEPPFRRFRSFSTSSLPPISPSADITASGSHLHIHRRATSPPLSSVDLSRLLRAPPADTSTSTAGRHLHRYIRWISCTFYAFHRHHPSRHHRRLLAFVSVGSSSTSAAIFIIAGGGGEGLTSPAPIVVTGRHRLIRLRLASPSVPPTSSPPALYRFFVFRSGRLRLATARFMVSSPSPQTHVVRYTVSLRGGIGVHDVLIVYRVFYALIAASSMRSSPLMAFRHDRFSLDVRALA